MGYISLRIAWAPRERGVLHVQSPLKHDLFQVTGAQGGAKVPADTQEHALGFGCDAI